MLKVQCITSSLNALFCDLTQLKQVFWRRKDGFVTQKLTMYAYLDFSAATWGKVPIEK